MKTSDSIQTIDLQQLERAAERLRSLAHPVRLTILELLQENSKMNVTEIYKAIKYEQAATSHHLKIMKENGFLASKRDGKMIFYSVKPKALKNIVDVIGRCNKE